MREALVAAGRSLFAAQGFAAVGTEAIVQAAGVTRGALYHHFADKTELFAAVFEAVEMQVIAEIGAAIAAAAPGDPVETMRLATSAWLDASAEPGIRRIALLEAPSVLGVMRWREITARYGMGMTQALLAQAMAAGRIAPQPVEPLAHVLLGALREAALYLAYAADQTQARREVGAVLDALVSSLDVA